MISSSSWLFCPPLQPHRLEAQDERIGNSSPNPLRHSTPLTHSRQVQLCAKPHQLSTSGQNSHLFGVRRDLIGVTTRNCTLPTIRDWNTRPLTAPRQRMIHTNPRATAPATSPNYAAQLAAPHSALAVGTDTPLHSATASCAFPRHNSGHAHNQGASWKPNSSARLSTTTPCPALTAARIWVTRAYIPMHTEELPECS